MSDNDDLLHDNITIGDILTSVKLLVKYWLFYAETNR